MNTFLKHPTQLTRRLPAVILVVWLICMADIALADSPIIAKLNLNQNGSVMTGELRFDLAGGNVQGQADVAANSSSTSPVKRQSGSPTAGRFQTRIELSGAYRGGPYGAMNGAAKLSGTFTDETNCVANLNGTGNFRGSVSAPLGLAEVTATWERVEFQGCNLTTPQPFSALLPPFTFEKTETIPILPTPLAGDAPLQPSGQPPPAGGNPTATNTTAGMLPLAVGGAVCALFGVLLVAGLVGITRPRARPARPIAPPPEHLPTRMPRPRDLPERGAPRKPTDLPR